MPRINDNYLKLKAGYLFPEIARRVRDFSAAHPDADVIRMGIGDVTEPLVPAITQALHNAVDEMGTREGFHGYGPEQGYAFLRDAIVANDFAPRGCDIAADEIFVSDGSKCDSANALDILGIGNVIAVSDPVYPVYVDTNVMAGHTGGVGDKGRYQGLLYLEGNESNGFVPDVPTERADVIYLCSPNNPTGSVMTREQLEAWVAYARKHRSLLLFDAAYEAYIRDDTGTLPHSIYEIPGAKDVAIELRSFSKTAGFTGVRAAYTVVPRGLAGTDADGNAVELYKLWMRRHTTKFNGISYIIQRGCEACFSPQGKQQVAERIAYYMANADRIRQTLENMGLQVFGGRHAPYVWVRTPGNADSWSFFDKLLNEAHIVCTPGAGFGACGEGYIRLSAFNHADKVAQACERLQKSL